jgi:FlaA1/EpsC-like NDP-sugar epimerase
MKKTFEGKRIVVTGGTGSLGQTIVRRLLTGEMGNPERVTVFSRDEAKQHYMRLAFHQKKFVTDEIIYDKSQKALDFYIGDVRDLNSVKSVLRRADIVINAAALKQVPNCEYFPYEAVQTNVTGPENIVRAVQESPVELVVGVSTDKAVKPINVMGMTKALQERIFIQANLRCRGTRFVCVRYGNVLTSRGSVIPLFQEQIRNGGPITITDLRMTRFLLSLDDAADAVFEAARKALPGEIYVAKVPSTHVANIARALLGDKKLRVKVVGIRPGEKMHEVLIGDEEAPRTIDAGKYYAITPMLPELQTRRTVKSALTKEYSSGDNTLDLAGTIELLKGKGCWEDACETS